MLKCKCSVSVSLDFGINESNTFRLDEDGHGAGVFIREFGVEKLDHISKKPKEAEVIMLWKLEGEDLVKVKDDPKQSDLDSNDIFLVDAVDHAAAPALYVWVGGKTVAGAGKRALQIGQNYLNQHRGDHRTASILRVKEGEESPAFLALIATRDT